MMSGSKAPDFDTYGLLRATHYHNPTLVSINFSIIRQCFKVHTPFVFCRYIFMVV